MLALFFCHTLTLAVCPLPSFMSRTPHVMCEEDLNVTHMNAAAAAGAAGAKEKRAAEKKVSNLAGFAKQGRRAPPRVISTETEYSICISVATGESSGGNRWAIRRFPALART